MSFSGTSGVSRSAHYRRLLVEPLEDRRMLAVVTVDTELDVVDFADGVTSLREAVFATNLVSGADTIDFDASLNGQTILLTQGELTITDELTIDGPGAAQLTIDAQQNSRIFHVAAASGPVTIEGLHLTGGDAAGSGGAILSETNAVLAIQSSTISGNLVNVGGFGFGDGGGIRASGNLTIVDSTISGNSAARDGGGIRASGNVTIVDSTISGNSAASDGGGISASGNVTIVDSTISDNSAIAEQHAFGGGISAGGNVTIVDSTISDNSATGQTRGALGGGIFADGALTITTSTISGNSATSDGHAFGGGILASGEVTVGNSTVSDNSATGQTGHAEGGGIWSIGLTITNSSVSNNSAISSDDSARGGGISIIGELTIVASTISGNMVEGKGSVRTPAGGGVYVKGPVAVTGSTISGNSTIAVQGSANGGGIASFSRSIITITSSTISGNSVLARGFAEGGGIFARGLLAVTESEISRNSADGNVPTGGGIYGVDVSVTGSTISGNSATGAFASGGGVFARGDVTVTNSTISGNSLTADAELYFRGGGGGIAADGDITVTSSTISGNSAGGGGGGGIYASATTTITQSTISENSAGGDGGGILASLATTISYSTISENTANTGGGLFVRSETANIDHTIIAGNRGTSTFGPDLTGLIGVTISPMFSLIGDNRQSGLAEAPLGSPDADGNLIGDVNGNGVIDPLLGSLGDYGGVTQTYALLSGSPAIDAGDPAVTFPPINDQRGAPFVRVFDGDGDTTGVIDIGAYERQGLGSPLTLVVDTFRDERDGDFTAGDLSLREAVGLANGNLAIAETITFDASLDGGTIVLGLGELLIADSLTIDASSLTSGLTIDASGNDPTPGTIQGDGSRVFNIDDGDGSNVNDVYLRGLTLTGGDQSDDGGAILSVENLTVVESNFMNNAARQGGAIRSFRAFGARLTIIRSMISGNSSRYGGGGILAGSDVTISGSMISGNSAGFRGGGVFGHEEVTITGSTISDNSAGFRGGGIGAIGDVTVIDSTISGNSATRYGGGIFTRGDVTVTNSTISGNSATGNFSVLGGGGIAVRGDITVTNSTISGNSVMGVEFGVGGGIFGSRGRVTITSSTISGNSATGGSLDDFTGGGGGIWVITDLVTIENSIVAGNESGAGTAPDLERGSGTLTVRYSLIGDNTDTGLPPAPVGMPDANGNLIGTAANPIDPLLRPLGDNGGPTFTHALLAGSPAIDAGNNASAPATDQRGFVRIVDGGSGTVRVDMGAFEFGSTIVGDANGDGVVDGADYTLWANQFGDPGPGQPADFNSDGVVDAADWTLWANNFGADETSGNSTPVPAIAATNSVGVIVDTLNHASQVSAPAIGVFPYEFSDSPRAPSIPVSLWASASLPPSDGEPRGDPFVRRLGERTNVGGNDPQSLERATVDAAIEQLLDEGLPNKWHNGSLVAHLSSGGDEWARLNRLWAYINEIRALERAGILSAAEGQCLIEGAEGLRNVLSVDAVLASAVSRGRGGRRN